MISEEWLNNLNNEFIEKGIPHRARAFEAYRRMCLEIIDTSFSSPEAKYLFEWFEKVTKPDSQKIILKDRFPFYYDGEFWLLKIPCFAGTVSLEPVEQYLEMPSEIKNRLISEQDNYQGYRYYFYTCLQYCTDFNEVISFLQKDTETKTWFKAADDELRAGIEIVLSEHSRGRSALNFRNLLEKFLKGLIFYKERLDTRNMKKISHNLEHAFDKLLEIMKYSELEELKPIIKKFPKVDDRYSENKYDNTIVFETLNSTQIIAFCILGFIKTELNSYGR